MVDLLSSPFNIDQSNQTWNLLESSVIHATSRGINESAAYSNNTINVYGDIYSPLDTGIVGVYSSGTGTTVNIMSSSYISTAYGVLINGSGAHVTNYGTIDSLSGIWSLATDTVIENYGKIFTNATGYGISTSGPATTNYASGLIIGYFGVALNAVAGQTSTLYNYGSITGSYASAYGNAGNDIIINKGSLTGNVYLNGGDDTYNGIGGTLTNGTISGGTGNDTYTIDQANIVLVENASAGIDQVNAAFSYTLGSYFENLTLTGTAATGTGNTLANIIKGNGSANTLYGMDGNDTIDGAAGSDLLYGGAGADVFVYAASNDIDTIKDFANGTDKIDVKGFSGISSFNDLKYNHVVASGANLIISSSYGQLIIENITLAQLDATDFIF